MRCFASAFAAMALLYSICLAHASDSDPGVAILSLNAEAKLIADGDSLAARVMLERDLEAAAETADRICEFNPFPETDVSRLTACVLAIVNGALVSHLNCLAEDGRSEIDACIADWQESNRWLWCLERESDRLIVSDAEGCEPASWSAQLRAIAEGLVAEAGGDHEMALGHYLRGRRLGVSVVRLELKLGSIDHRIPAAAFVSDAVASRIVALRYATSIEPPLFMPGSKNVFCYDRIDLGYDPAGTCPGSVSALRAIGEYAVQDYSSADQFLQMALGHPQSWLASDPYLHPLIWRALLARQSNDEVSLRAALAYTAEFGSNRADDLNVALSLLSGDLTAAMPAPVECTTPGCLYLLGQLLGFDGHEIEAKAVVAQGIEACSGMRSVLCTVLRVAAFNIAQGGNP